MKEFLSQKDVLIVILYGYIIDSQKQINIYITITRYNVTFNESFKYINTFITFILYTLL